MCRRQARSVASFSGSWNGYEKVCDWSFFVASEPFAARGVRPKCSADSPPDIQPRSKTFLNSPHCQRAELKQAGSARRQLESVLSDYQARELYAATASNAAGLRKALVREPSGTLDQLRGLAQAFAPLPGAVFVGAIDQPPAVLVSASADSGIHAGRVLRGILDLVGGRGGGSAALAQGTLSVRRSSTE